MATAPRKTLLTGFGPFGEVIDNPTERLARHFEEHGIEGHRLTVRVLPVSYRRAPGLLLETIQQAETDGDPFDVVWMLGVASASATWRVERFGRNRNGSDPDADAFTPPPRIVEEGPELLEATVPVGTLASALIQAGLPAAQSESAGAYLCNHALFTALWHTHQASARFRAGFLHVPPDPVTMAAGASTPVPFEFKQHIQAVEITLAVLK